MTAQPNQHGIDNHLPAPVVTIDSLSIRNHGKTLVDNLSLRLMPGERVGLIGESGSGKSLTALSLMGLVPPNLFVTGTGEVCGLNPFTATEAELCRTRGRRISMVFQEPMTALNPLMRIGAQIAEALRLHNYHGNITQRVLELLTEVQLPDPEQLVRRYPHQLSGGQRQRVLIAIALANDPEVLICDEPTTALDVTVQREIVQLILALVQRRGTALLFITHDLALVSQVSERIVVLRGGVQVESGPTAAVLRSPAHPYTRGLMAASDLRARDNTGHFYTVQSADDSYRPGVQLARPSLPTPGEPLLTGQQLSKTFGGGFLSRRPATTAVDGVDITLLAGQRLGLVGGSGSGKTTVLKMLAGLLTPTSGQVSTGEVAGHPARVQIVFQDPFDSLNPRMTIGDAVAEPLRAAGGPTLSRAGIAARVNEVLDEVGISAQAAQRYPHEFSGGQRQRISIARALAPRPDVLLADEPVSALDVSVRAQVMNVLVDMCSEYGLSLLFVSHDLGVVGELCQDIVVLSQGKIVEAGSVSSVFANPQHPYTAALLESVPRLQRV